MLTVFKTQLEITDEQKVELQQGSSIVKIDVQDGQLTLWYLCDPERELVEETFYVVGTGQQLPDTFPGIYIDTVEMHHFEEDPDGQGGLGQSFIWHVFFKRRPSIQLGKPIVATRNPNDPGMADTRGNDGLTRQQRIDAQKDDS